MIIEKVAPPLTSPMDTNHRLTAAVQLFDALNQAGIRYCHWKSNIRLEDGLSGCTDLDLLVDPSDEIALRNLMAELGFKSLIAPPGKKFPGVEHMLGFDRETGSLIHVHLHFKMVLGEQLVKNYCLPLETQFLDTAISRSGVRIPMPELDLIVLCLRTLLKYRDRDVIKDILKIRSPGIPDYFLAEINWLSVQITPRSFDCVLSSVSNILPVEAIQRFIQIVRKEPRNGWELLRLRTDVRRGLHRYRRQDQVGASMTYFRALLRKSRQGDRQMGLPVVGRKIALVGADGSGKTSLSDALLKWLGWKIDTHLLYLGSKQPSRLSDALYWFFRIARRSQTELVARLGDDNSLAQLVGRMKNFLLAQHYLSIGRDRLRRYKLGSRLARGGSVIFFDRFPFEAPLDGPEIGRIPVKHPNELSRLKYKEEELYQRFQPVDRLIILEAPVDVSFQRKPDHPMEVIQAKNDALAKLKDHLSLSENNWDWVSIDASLPKEEVLLAVKRAVWEVL